MKNNLVFVIFDSCRFDTFVAAKTRNIDRIGATEKRYSYASWTVPAHAVYLMGASPHSSPKGVFASEVYKKDFINWGTRLGIDDISFSGFVPRLSLPAFLKEHGYSTHARVSLPVLNQATIMNQHFDSYKLMKAHNDFSAIVDDMEFEKSAPSFWFINVGETHYPYTLPGESADNLPRISGVHGVFKSMDQKAAEKAEGKDSGSEFFNMAQMNVLKDKQRTNVEYLDGVFEKLYEKLPANTHLIVTSDHGELFGEDGYFGHGPVVHEKVFEVFFTEGRIK